MGYLAAKHFKSPSGVPLAPGDKLGDAGWPALPSYIRQRFVIAAPDDVEDEIARMLRSGVHMAHVLKRLPRTHAPLPASRFAVGQTLQAKSHDERVKQEVLAKAEAYFKKPEPELKAAEPVSEPEPSPEPQEEPPKEEEEKKAMGPTRKRVARKKSPTKKASAKKKPARKKSPSKKRAKKKPAKTAEE